MTADTTSADAPARADFFPATAEINLAALLHNFREVSRKIGPERSIIAVVKADAYGHGAVQVSQTLQDAGVKMLGVALVQEGAELRQAGIRVPILMMGSLLKEQIPLMIEHQLTPVLFQPELLPALEREAEQRNMILPIHLKVDTGMGRLGIQPAETAAFLKEISRHKRLKVEGLMTHLANADRRDKAASAFQIALWNKILKIVRDSGLEIPYIHVSNSAAILNLPEIHSNPVRPGIMLYGYVSGFQPELSLEPVLSFKTRVVHLKTVPQGTPVSYGGIFTTSRKSIIATLAVGYADGYSRILSNTAQVLIRGKRVPVVGRVCMDMTMADVTENPEVALGDEAVLIGKQGSDIITAAEVAGWAGTIPYEILCAISKRVPRVYKGAE